MRRFRHCNSMFGSIGLGIAVVLASVPVENVRAQDAAAGGLEKIVVTAQRREENLQDVPIAVTAINADAVAKSGISATIQLNQVVPSVRTNTSASRSGATT